jgi:hypothetical protein
MFFRTLAAHGFHQRFSLVSNRPAFYFLNFHRPFSSQLQTKDEKDRGVLVYEVSQYPEIRSLFSAPLEENHKVSQQAQFVELSLHCDQSFCPCQDLGRKLWHPRTRCHKSCKSFGRGLTDVRLTVPKFGQRFRAM